MKTSMNPVKNYLSPLVRDDYSVKTKLSWSERKLVELRVKKILKQYDEALTQMGYE